MARLRLHYAARIAALLLTSRDDADSALAALQSERDAALEQLRLSHAKEKERALQAVRLQRTRRRRFRIPAFVRQQRRDTRSRPGYPSP